MSAVGHKNTFNLLRGFSKLSFGIVNRYDLASSLARFLLDDPQSCGGDHLYDLLIFM